MNNRRSGLKLKGWTAQPPPEPDKAEAIRNLAIKEVYSKYFLSGEASTLVEISDKVKSRIQQLIWNSEWPITYGMPSKRTIDRRVNEACEPTWFEDGVPRLAAKTSGYYVPNPVRFLESCNKKEVDKNEVY